MRDLIFVIVVKLQFTELLGAVTQEQIFSRDILGTALLERNQAATNKHSASVRE